MGNLCLNKASTPTINRLYLHITLRIASENGVQLQLEKFFCFFFFLGWARPVGRKVSSGWARPVASSLQAVKQFIFIFILYLGLNGIYIAGEPSKADASAPGLLTKGEI